MNIDKIIKGGIVAVIGLSLVSIATDIVITIIDDIREVKENRKFAEELKKRCRDLKEQIEREANEQKQK